MLKIKARNMSAATRSTAPKTLSIIMVGEYKEHLKDFALQNFKILLESWGLKN